MREIQDLIEEKSKNKQINLQNKDERQQTKSPQDTIQQTKPAPNRKRKPSPAEQMESDGAHFSPVYKKRKLEADSTDCGTTDCGTNGGTSFASSNSQSASDSDQFCQFELGEREEELRRREEFHHQREKFHRKMEKESRRRERNLRDKERQL